MLLGTKLLPGVAVDTSPSWRFLKIFVVIIFPLLWSKRHHTAAAAAAVAARENFPSKNWFRVYLRRCSSIESYTLHKEQTNSFFNAARTGFRKRAGRAAPGLRRRWNAGDSTVWKLVRRKCFPRLGNIGPEKRLRLFQRAPLQLAESRRDSAAYSLGIIQP